MCREDCGDLFQANWILFEISSLSAYQAFVVKRPMKENLIHKITFAAAALAVILPAPLWSAEEVRAGMPVSELLETRPEPDGTIDAGSMQVLKWPDLVVHAKDGKVTRIKVIEQEIRQPSKDTEEERRLRAERLRQKRIADYQAIQRRNAASARIWKEKERRVARVKESLERAKDRWEFKEKEIYRQNGRTRDFVRFQELKEKYLRAYEEEIRAIYNEDARSARIRAGQRSRLELDLNKMGDDLLDEGTIDVRNEHFIHR